MALLTVVITTEPLLDTVGGRLVTVGRGVTVPVGMVWVEVCVSVDGLVTVGNALGTKTVGNGVNVTEPKLNKAVGVAPMTSLGKTFGLGEVFEEFCDLNGNKLSRMEHRK
jgi:hypothetical protein